MRADPQLISFKEWPCICGRWSVLWLNFWHRWTAGHSLKRATHVNADGRLVAADDEVGAMVRSS